MEKYIKSLSALNNLTLTNKNSEEIDRYAESDLFWAANKNKPLPHRIVKKGTVYQFEFGKNYVPEMSYEHRGLVLGSSGKLLYVLPIFSYNRSNNAHQDAYHPLHNPNSKSNYFLLEASEFPFLTHDSLLKLNDLRTVSILRIKYKQENGYLNPNSDTYHAIEKLVLKKYFPVFAYQYEQLLSDYERFRQSFEEQKDANQP